MGVENQSQSFGFTCFKCSKLGQESCDCKKTSQSHEVALFVEELRGQTCEALETVYNPQILCEEISSDIVKPSREVDKFNDQESRNVIVAKEMEHSCTSDDVPLFVHYEDDLTLNADSLLHMMENMEMKPVSITDPVCNEVIEENQAHELTLDLLPNLSKADCVVVPAVKEHTRQHVENCSQEVLSSLAPKQVGDPLGLVCTQASLVHCVMVYFLQPSMDCSWCMLRASGVFYVDDIGGSKRHAKWVSYLHVSLAAVDVHKRKLILKQGHFYSVIENKNNATTRVVEVAVQYK